MKPDNSSLLKGTEFDAENICTFFTFWNVCLLVMVYCLVSLVLILCTDKNSLNRHLSRFFI